VLLHRWLVCTQPFKKIYHCHLYSKGFFQNKWTEKIEQETQVCVKNGSGIQLWMELCSKKYAIKKEICRHYSFHQDTVHSMNSHLQFQ